MLRNPGLAPDKGPVKALVLSTFYLRGFLYTYVGLCDAEPQLDGSAGEHEPQSESEIADLDARLVGMAVLLRVTLRFMKA